MSRLHARIAYLYEDDDLLAVHKPAGIATVHDAARPDEADLHAWLEAQVGRLWVVHRLDRETSGVVVFARNEASHRALSARFEERDVTKIYHAILVGHPPWSERTVDAPLRADADRRHRTVVDVIGGKPAVTHFRVLRRLRRFALVEARPETGRTHQIRVHAALLGHPVAVDDLYGEGRPIFLSHYKPDYRPGRDEEQPLMGRLALHALALRFPHPRTGETVELYAPYAKDFNATLNQLGKLA